MRPPNPAGAIIYFVDEASVRSDAHCSTTWGKIGQTPEVEDSGDRFSLRVSSAVSPRGDMKFDSFEGRMTAVRFVDSVKKLHLDASRPIIVITDNARYLTGKAVRGQADESQGEVTVDYLLRYSPEPNPEPVPEGRQARGH